MTVNEPVSFSGRGGGQFYSRENAGSGGFGHGDLLFGADSPSLSKDDGIAWVSGQGGVRGGTSILEFAVENVPNNAGHSPAFMPEIDDQVLLFSPEAGGNNSIWIDIEAPGHARVRRRSWIRAHPTGARRDRPSAIGLARQRIRGIPRRSRSPRRVRTKPEADCSWAT